MSTLEKRLAKLEEKLAALNANHRESHDEGMLRLGAPTSYAKNRADTPRSKVELKRRELTQKISVLRQKLDKGGRRTRRRRHTRRHR